MNSVKGALCASLFLVSSALANQPLVGVSWQAPSELTAIATLSEQVRYVARGIAFVEASESAVKEFTKQGFDILCLDRPRAGDRYFVADHLHFPLPQDIELIFDGGGEWALLRIGPTARLYEASHFLWPLPNNYSLKGWLDTPRRAPKALQTASPAVAALIEEVAAERLQTHVEALALKDPALGSVPGNSRSRFAVHPEILESTEYIRSQLAAVLGDEAVELHSFPIDSRRVTSHTSRRGNRGHAPSDTTAYNVIGTLAGTDPEAGYYIVCAHYDATGTRSVGGWDWQRDPAPGADDNASGVALVIESAKLLAGQRFPWSILFIAWSGEELGLLGSQAYAVLAADRDDPILGVLNFDMIGFNDLQQRLELVTNPGSRWLADQMVSVAERYAIELNVDLLEDGGARLSDHAPFWARGYDAILGIENYLPTDSTTYGVREGRYRINSQYHSVVDLPDSINWELVRRTTQLTVATLAEYGLGEGTPNLAVFTGDLRSDRADDLRVRVSNIGLGAVASS
ncbi:MAG: M28 family metallopeptidase, partial [Gemmatimonadota bacterium]|nr:M28 family metallopeptidase [Gemmatimonadota bacterium]